MASSRAPSGTARRAVPLAGPVLTVRPYCHDKNYWQVYFDTNMLIHQTFTKAGYPAAENPLLVRTFEAS